MISPKKKLLLLHSSNDLYGASKIFLQLIDLFISKDFNVHVVLPEKGKLDVFLNKKDSLTRTTSSYTYSDRTH